MFKKCNKILTRSWPPNAIESSRDITGIIRDHYRVGRECVWSSGAAHAAPGVSVSWFKDSIGGHAEDEKIKSFQSICIVRRHGKVICSHWGTTTSLSKTSRQTNIKLISLKAVIPLVFQGLGIPGHGWARYLLNPCASYLVNHEQKFLKKVTRKSYKKWRTMTTHF